MPWYLTWQYYHDNTSVLGRRDMLALSSVLSKLPDLLGLADLAIVLNLPGCLQLGNLCLEAYWFSVVGRIDVPVFLALCHM